ncbi:uncharacterized protein [Panulirus ornatus]|uniref:uncharacterized protein isoform X5 n=1 Tax=Panulirus ornatus TaxID=150431 RepID=UPI003A88BF65
MMRWRRWRWWQVALVISLTFGRSRAVFEDADIEVGESVDFGRLNLRQFSFVAVSTVVFVLLWAVGVFPMDIHLGRRRRRDDTSWRSKMEETSFLLDCPLQFVCDVDDWANREDHQHYAERLLASWFRNPKHSWHQPGADVYTGIGTCKEMYPCPFDVQEVIGIRIPGSNDLTSSSSSSANSQEDSYVF